MRMFLTKRAIINSLCVLGAVWIGALVVLSHGDAAEEVLRNDSWEPGQGAYFGPGFVSGEIAASRLVPESPVQIVGVQFLFGGAEPAGTYTITLHIWDDSLETIQPGAEWYSAEYELTAANQSLQVIDLAGEDLPADSPFRVGIEFQHDGLPSVADDQDGITPDRNLLFSGSWLDAGGPGLTGDWVIRALVQGGPSYPNYPIHLPVVLR
jgi:hypothetical protein